MSVLVDDICQCWQIKYVDVGVCLVYNKYDVELYLCACVCEYDPLCVCHHKRTHTTDEVNQKIEKTITFKWGLGWKEGQRYLCLHTQS